MFQNRFLRRVANIQNNVSDILDAFYYLKILVTFSNI